MLYNLTTGVEVWVGVPGSGKSYCAVRELIRICLQERRPIYTNLPIKMRQIKFYLRKHGGDKAAALVHRLNESHWRAWLKRCASRREYLEEHKTGFTAGDAAERFDAEYPPVYSGNKADSIPSAAVVMIDEVQLWHPPSKMVPDGDVLAYTSVHRHYLHRVIVLSQALTTVDLAFRKQMDVYIDIRKKQHDKLAWGITFGMVGVRGVAMSMYSGDVMRGGSYESDPYEQRVILASLPCNSVYYRLYEPWTNAGSARVKAKELQRLREEAGIRMAPVMRRERRETVSGFLHRISRRIVRLGMYAVLGSVCGAVGYSLRGESVAAKEVASAEQSERIEWPTWSASTPTAVVWHGRRISVGGSVDGVTLLNYDYASRSLMCERGGNVYRWVHGSAPSDVGPSGIVLAWLKYRNGRGLAAADSSATPAVDTPSGQPER